MTCIVAISDALVSKFAFSIEEGTSEKPEMRVWHLNPPGLPLPVVAAALKHVQPKVAIVVLSDGPHLREEELQTVDAVATVSSEAPFFLPILQPFIRSEPVPFLRTSDTTKLGGKLRHNQPPVLNELKSVVDSLKPAARKHMITELQTVLMELADAA